MHFVLGGRKYPEQNGNGIGIAFFYPVINLIQQNHAGRISYDPGRIIERVVEHFFYDSNIAAQGDLSKCVIGRPPNVGIGGVEYFWLQQVLNHRAVPKLPEGQNYRLSHVVVSVIKGFYQCIYHTLISQFSQLTGCRAPLVPVYAVFQCVDVFLDFFIVRHVYPLLSLDKSFTAFFKAYGLNLIFTVDICFQSHRRSKASNSRACEIPCTESVFHYILTAFLIGT